MASYYSHRYFIEAGGKKFRGEAELTGTFARSDESISQGQTATEDTAITTFLTAANTLKTALGELADVTIRVEDNGSRGKK